LFHGDGEVPILNKGSSKNLINTPESDLAGIFYQMLSAVSHCHEVHVVHRDVKPHNFLLAGENGKTIKLCDFGVAAIQHKTTKLNGTFGTPAYMSPEMVRGIEHDEKTDVWSCGATAYVVLFADYPYMPRTMSAENVKRAIRKDVPAISFQRPDPYAYQPSDQAIAFVKSLLDRSAKTRCSAKDAMRHSFLEHGYRKHSGLERKQEFDLLDELIDNNVPFEDGGSTATSSPSYIDFKATDSILKVSCLNNSFESNSLSRTVSTASGGSETAESASTPV